MFLLNSHFVVITILSPMVGSHHNPTCMKPRRIIKLTLSDESRLQQIGSVTITPLKGIVACLVVMLTILAVGFLLVLLTPLKTLIPGYFRESERAATEQALLRVDSIREAYRRNEAYVANIHERLNTTRAPKAAQSSASAPRPIAADSLLPPSAAETSFARVMQEREKFNISVVAPMAAEGMLFYPVSDEGIVTHLSRNARQARVSLPAGASVMSVADGVVIASYAGVTPRSHTLIVQHDNGFVSRYSGLGSPLVGEGEFVLGGQVLCQSPSAPSGRPIEIVVELWHNTVPLIPYDYISSHHSYTSLQP